MTFFLCLEEYLSSFQGLPGPPGEKGENGDVGPMVSVSLSAPFQRFILFSRTTQWSGKLCWLSRVLAGGWVWQLHHPLGMCFRSLWKMYWHKLFSCSCLLQLDYNKVQLLLALHRDSKPCISLSFFCFLCSHIVIFTILSWAITNYYIDSGLEESVMFLIFCNTEKCFWKSLKHSSCVLLLHFFKRKI